MGLDLVCERLGLARPFAARHRAFVLVEAAAGTDPTVALADAIEGLTRSVDVAVAGDDRAARDLWRYREAHTEAFNLLGPRTSSTSRCPPTSFPGFVAEVADQVSAVAPGAVVWLFGHAADGNIHVNVTGVDPDDDRVTDAVLRLVARMHGSISAEHGIGAAKREWLHLVRSRAEIDAFRSIKRALDPDGVLIRTCCCRRSTITDDRVTPRECRLVVRLDSAVNLTRLGAVLPHRPVAPRAGVVARVAGWSDRPPPTGDPSVYVSIGRLVLRRDTRLRGPRLSSFAGARAVLRYEVERVPTCR
jgi:hypothetical protein